MSLLESIFMGFIQGLTEFLPVSSSGHLAIFQCIFHINTDTGMLFELLLHVGTLVAVCAVYYKDIWNLVIEFFKMLGNVIYNFNSWRYNRKSGRREHSYKKVVSNPYQKFGLLIIVTSIPTGIIGFAASDLVDTLSSILIVPGICLVITGILLLISDRLKDGTKGPKEASYTNAFAIGISQGLATLPGLSRSGTTITACLLCGFNRKFAVKYSFIMSIPAIVGGTLKELLDVGSATIMPGEVFNYIVGMVVAGVVGYFCIKTMLVVVQKKRFTYFAIYCFAVGLLSIAGYFWIA